VITLLSCGSKKKFSKVDSVENSKSTEQLYTELYREARLLEFLDIKFRKVETRDSAGNVRIETDVDFSKKTEENTRDSTKITGTRQETGEKVVNQKSEEERSGAIKYWTWIIGFVTVSMIVAIVVYLMKK
jgi:hypothetical protein